jgi:PelA/Pel-15E family pectate lyase
VDFDPSGSKIARYRNGKGKGHNNSTLDDGISQSAIRFLAHADRALGQKNVAVHDAAVSSLESLLKAQYPNGAFPQIWTGPTPRTAIKKASYPAYDWRTEGKIKNYWDMYTLNDQLVGYVADTIQEAGEIYKNEECRKALARLGDFLILAQMPDPQPAWAQQYSYDMHPIWARRFEPPAVTGSESQDAIETLMRIYRLTKDTKYLEPIPRALAYLKKSTLPNGQLARYYELQSNRPLYMNRNGDSYSLTYDDTNLPDHYGWKVGSRLERIEKSYTELKAGRPAPPTPVAGAELEKRVRIALQELDAEGRWVTTYERERLVGQPKFTLGDRYLSSAVFSRNVELLSTYLATAR